MHLTGSELSASFNSNMVQLRVRRSNDLVIINKFQFQYGTIKSFTYLKQFKKQRLISIPVWYD